MSRFITFEGTEGVGKTTQIQLLNEYLQSKNIKTVVTREPGGTIAGEKIRSILLDRDEKNISPSTELLLMFAARAQHLHEVIYPNLKNNTWVICDRFTDASYAYQGGGRGLPLDEIKQLEVIVHNSFKPDLTIFLDCEINIGMQRVIDRGEKDRFENEEKEFYKRVYDMYMKIVNENQDRIKVVKADLPQKEVATKIQTIVNENFSELSK